MEDKHQLQESLDEGKLCADVRYLRRNDHEAAHDNDSLRRQHPCLPVVEGLLQVLLLCSLYLLPDVLKSCYNEAPNNDSYHYQGNHHQSHHNEANHENDDHETHNYNYCMLRSSWCQLRYLDHVLLQPVHAQVVQEDLRLLRTTHNTDHGHNNYRLHGQRSGLHQVGQAGQMLQHLPHQPLPQVLRTLQGLRGHEPVLSEVEGGWLLQVRWIRATAMSEELWMSESYYTGCHEADNAEDNDSRHDQTSDNHESCLCRQIVAVLQLGQARLLPHFLYKEHVPQNLQSLWTPCHHSAALYR